MNVKKDIKIGHVISLIFLSVIWGSSYILMKKGLLSYTPLEMTILRILIAGVCFIPLTLRYLIKERLDSFWKYLTVGMTGIAIPSFLFALAETQISSSIAGVLNSLTPIFTLIIGMIFFKVRGQRKQIIGIFLGFLGVIAIIILGQENNANNSMRYSGFVIICSILYAFNINFIKHFFQNENSLRLTAVSFSIVFLPALIYFLFSEIPMIMKTSLGLESLGYIFLLSMFSTMLALIIFYRLVQETNPVFASSNSYIVPVIALLWGYLVDEFIGFGHYLSLGVIVGGVYLIQKN
ncbi:MAG: DMT family transporter [Winogradskyella sp.]